MTLVAGRRLPPPPTYGEISARSELDPHPRRGSDLLTPLPRRQAVEREGIWLYVRHGSAVGNGSGVQERNGCGVGQGRDG